MSLSDWTVYTAPNENTILPTVSTAKQDKNVSTLNLRGKNGHAYLLPQHQETGYTSACLQVAFHKKVFSEFSEIRLYCMLSHKDIRNDGQGYVAALHGDKRVSLFKYTNGLYKSPHSLISLRLPAEYKQGMFGLLWAYEPTIRPGVFFQCFLNVTPNSPQSVFRLFEYLDKNDPLPLSEGEGFGMSNFQKKIAQASFTRITLRTLTFTDPKENYSDGISV